MKGEVRNPMTQWLLILLTGGIYIYYLVYTIGNELKEYLGKEDLNPAMDIVLIICTCGIYGFYLPFKYGALIVEAQQRAGVPNPQNHGLTIMLMNLLCQFGWTKMQEETNRIWEAGGAAPQAY